MEIEPPPRHDPQHVPSPEQFGRLALDLLRELARYDPLIEQRLRDEDLEALDPPGSPLQATGG